MTWRLPSRKRALLVEIGARAVADEAAVARIERKRLGERRRKRLLDADRRRFETLGDPAELPRQAERAAGA